MEIMEVPIDVPTQQKVLFIEENLGLKIGAKPSLATKSLNLYGQRLPI